MTPQKYPQNACLLTMNGAGVSEFSTLKSSCDKERVRNLWKFSRQPHQDSLQQESSRYGEEWRKAMRVHFSVALTIRKSFWQMPNHSPEKANPRCWERFA